MRSGLFLVLAVFCLAGCAGLAPLFQPAGDSNLELLKQFYRQADYHRSLEQGGAIIARGKRDPAYDQALYYMALNYLQIDSRRNDYSRAIACFQRIISECPGSYVLPESAKWFTVLTELVALQDKLAVVRLTRQEQERLISRNASKLDRHQTRIRQLQSQLHDKKGQMQHLRSDVEDLRLKIEMLEKVDLQIHQQKVDLKNAPHSGEE
ncbi:MAG: hypothetical protein GY868_11145 [Deltaproteobacteria bacterium]|nr:hypothetical protein [Deltaproteobacteria bacterium]